MSKAPKQENTRAKALAGMTKAELIKTVKALDRRQTALLNELARLARPETKPDDVERVHVTPAPPLFPWSTCEGS